MPIAPPLLQSPVRSWALGLAGARLAGAPAYGAAAQTLYAAAQPETDGGAAHSTLLAWPAKADGGSLKAAAAQAQLPAAVHSLHPLAAPSGAAMDVDASDQPALFAVFTSGAVAACSPGLGVVSQSAEAEGQAPLAASLAADGSSLAVVLADPRSGGASCSSYALQVGDGGVSLSSLPFR